MLFVHRGAVRVLIYRTTFTISCGGFFLVPRGECSFNADLSEVDEELNIGNSYEIENIGMDDAQVVFMQGREVKVTEGSATED